MKRILALLVSMGMSLAAGSVWAAGMASLTVEDLNGCIGATSDGRKMACVGYTNGRVHLEIKEVETRRLHQVFILGSEANPLKASTTPKDKVRSILASLDKQGFIPTRQGRKDIVDVFRIPGLTCGLSLAANEDRVQVQSQYGKGQWLAKDGLRGETVLSAVSVSYEHSQIFLVLDHTTPEGDATIREFKVLRLQDLTDRDDCEKEGAKKKAIPAQAAPRN